MKTAIVGYGRMGKEIEQILLEKGHEIVLIADSTPTTDQLKDAEVAIEFSNPQAALNNLNVLIENQIPTVCGTTGWLNSFDEISNKVKTQNGALLYASNFSLGVNLFFALNEHLATLMSKYPEYKVDLQEIHHTAKLDAPSGTAISLAEPIIEKRNLKSWSLKPAESAETIPIESIREGKVPGTHSIHYESVIDSIEIKHTAHNRKGFAAGAVLAAEWIKDKKGVFSMRDVLGV